MTQEQKVIRAKVGMLELARQLGNVSQACRVMGYLSARNWLWVKVKFSPDTGFNSRSGSGSATMIHAR